MTVTISGFDCELADGVRETTQTTGTGTYQLDGPATIEGTTYRSFVAGVGNGVRVPYVVWFGNEFEVGLGTVSSGAPATISRDTILVSSNSDSEVSWGPGVKDIWLDAPASLLDQIGEKTKVTVFTSSGTFTKEATCVEAWVRVVGGGGGGGGSAATSSGEAAVAGGGGGGGYAEELIAGSSLGSTVTVTIGAGGAFGVAGANDGGNGGTTSFGAFLSATGGSGGGGSAASSGSTSAAGGLGGTGSGGDLNVPGGDGGNGRVISGFGVFDGHGGSTALAGITRGPLSSNGGSGNGYGGGGSGASASASLAARNGGAGAAGVCIVHERYHG